MRISLGELRSLIQEAILATTKDSVTIDARDAMLALKYKGEMYGYEGDAFVYSPYQVPMNFTGQDTARRAKELKSNLYMMIENTDDQRLKAITPFEVITAVKKGSWQSIGGMNIIAASGVLESVISKMSEQIVNKFKPSKIRVDVVMPLDSRSPMTQMLAASVAKGLGAKLVSKDEGGFARASEQGEIKVDWAKVDADPSGANPKTRNLIKKAEEKIAKLIDAGEPVSISQDVTPQSIRRYFTGVQQLKSGTPVGARHILVVDDNYDQGVTSKDVRNMLDSVDAEVSFAVGYKLPQTKGMK